MHKNPSALSDHGFSKNIGHIFGYIAYWEELIGSNFSDNEHFQAAMSGRLTFEMTVPDRPEPATEREESSVL